MTQGIDVSRYQGVISWPTVRAAGVEFAYIKASQGKTWRDPNFVQNARGAKAAGVKWGAYHYFENTLDSIEQARYFRSSVETSGIAPDLVPALDVEQEINHAMLTPTKVLACLREMDRLFATTSIIYTRASFWDRFVLKGALPPEWSNRYWWWIAHYTTDAAPNLPKGCDRYAIWQYSSQGAVHGIVGNVDLNRLNPQVPLEHLQILLPPPEPPIQSVATIIRLTHSNHKNIGRFDAHLAQMVVDFNQRGDVTDYVTP